MSPILDSIGSVKGYGWGSFSLSTSFESIATVSVGSGGSSSISFTSIPATYTHLQLRLSARTSNIYNYDWIFAEINSNTTANKSIHFLLGDGASVSAGSGTNDAKNFAGMVMGGSTNASAFGVSITDILDYADTNKNKTIRILSGGDSNGNGQVRFTSSLFPSTSAITSIRLWTSDNANFVQYSHFALYGIKGA